MATAPEPYMTAALDTIRWALICCRNWTLGESICRAQVNNLMEAIHEIPGMLMNWREHSLDELRTHLGCFHFEKWRELNGGNAVTTPDLVAWFDRRVRELEHQQ